MTFYDNIISYRTPAKIINTPKEAGVGCGLSVKLLMRDLSRAKLVLSRGNYPSFIGIYGLPEGKRPVKLE